MQYTEENYTELYNNLPKGLRDLVLSGELTNLSNAIAIKYSLTPEQTSDLEPAIEDVALGLVTVEDLKDNVAFQLNLNENQADTLSREIIKTILDNHIEELRLTRKYKIELDEKIRKQKGISVETTVNTNQNKQNVAENIISATRESANLMNNISKKTLGEELLYNSDKKVSDWYAGGKTKTQMELDSFTGNIPVNNVKVKRDSDVENKKPVVKIEAKIDEVKNTDVWNNLINKNLEPIHAKTDFVNNTNQGKGESMSEKSLDKSMLQVEQQIFTLTQSINKLLTQDTFTKNKTITTNLKDIFDTDEYKTINDKLDSLTKRIGEMQSEIQVLKIDKVNNIPKAVSFNEANIKHDEIKISQSDNLSEIKESKKEFNIEDLLKNRSVDHNNQASRAGINSSVVSEGAMEAIFENRKSNVSRAVMSQANIPEVSIKIPVLETVKEKVEVTEEMTGKISDKDTLLNDLNFLKTENENLDDNNVNLKQEIMPDNDSDRMKSLQDKIKSLNKGIGYGGITNTMSLDPYKQAI